MIGGRPDVESSRPTVDVVIAVRNEAAKLGACLESLLAQDYPSSLVNIFVVDNGSTDGTIALATRYPVTLLHEARKGPAAARNRAVKAGSGELVAFFDGHCIANEQWISAMSACLDDRRVGGAQAKIQNTAANARVQRHLESSEMTDNRRVLDDTVKGTQNIYPWILSGNCMYRRDAMDLAGGFDESLPACEDVDLAWKVVLCGYLLVSCDGAAVIHWNGDTWKSFVRKSWVQGRGAAVLARRYLPLGARNAFRPAMMWGNGGDRSRIAVRYWAGYKYESARLAIGVTRTAASAPLPHTSIDTRSWFQWTETRTIRISLDAIYWFPDQSSSIVVHNPSRSRIVLEGSADLIWRYLALGQSRVEIASGMAAVYNVDVATATSDLDVFVGELLESEVLELVAA